MRGSGGPAATAGPAPEQIQAARVKAEELFSQRADLSKLREAVKVIGQVRDPENRDYDVEWNYARYNYFLGRHSPDEDEADKAFNQGKDSAKIAANVEPNRPEGHFWYGANFGELCRRSPVTVGMRNVGEVRETMQRVIQLDPKYQGAAAYDVLAQIELATRIKDGTAEKAAEYLETAIGLEKNNSELYLHLGQAYLTLNREADAKKQLEHILKMSPDPGYIPEHNDAVAAAQRLLATKFD